jgi:hypothetical protein
MSPSSFTDTQASSSTSQKKRKHPETSDDEKTLFDETEK